MKRLLEAEAGADTKGDAAEDTPGTGGERAHKLAASPPALGVNATLKPTAAVPPTLVLPLSHSYPPTARTPAVTARSQTVVTPQVSTTSSSNQP